MLKMCSAIEIFKKNPILLFFDISATNIMHKDVETGVRVRVGVKVGVRVFQDSIIAHLIASIAVPF